MYFTGHIFALDSVDVKTPKNLIEWMIPGYCDVTVKWVMTHEKSELKKTSSQAGLSQRQ